jgi:hypothetical protein
MYCTAVAGRDRSQQAGLNFTTALPSPRELIIEIPRLEYQVLIPYFSNAELKTNSIL